MASDRGRQSDSCGVVAAVLLLLFLFVGVMAVGSIFWLLTQRLMVVERERAMEARDMAEQMRRVAEFEREQAVALAETEPESVTGASQQHVTIELGEEGSTSLDGITVEMTALATELQRLRQSPAGPLSLLVKVDSQCRFEHVARILSLCEETGVERSSIHIEQGPNE